MPIRTIHRLLLIILGTFCYLLINSHLSNGIEDTSLNGIEFLKPHDSVLNSNLSYPSTWILKKNSENNITFTTLEEQVRISIISEPSPTQSLEELAQSGYDDIRKWNGTIIRSSFVDLMGIKVYEYEYAYEDSYIITQIRIILGTKAFYIFHEGYPEAYYRNLPMFQKFRDSLNLTSSVNVGKIDNDLMIPKKADIKLSDKVTSFRLIIVILSSSVKTDA